MVVELHLPSFIENALLGGAASSTILSLLLQDNFCCNIFCCIFFATLFVILVCWFKPRCYLGGHNMSTSHVFITGDATLSCYCRSCVHIYLPNSLLWIWWTIATGEVFLCLFIVSFLFPGIDFSKVFAPAVSAPSVIVNHLSSQILGCTEFIIPFYLNVISWLNGTFVLC